MNVSVAALGKRKYRSHQQAFSVSPLVYIYQGAVIIGAILIKGSGSLDRERAELNAALAARTFREAISAFTPAVTDAGHTRSFEDTYQWLHKILDRVPVSRVTDVTPLVGMGIPVWSATTPMASDLTVHAGKGKTSIAAWIGAVMEGIERVTAESVPANRVVAASFNNMSAEFGDEMVVPPVTLNLPFNTTYRPEREISWCSGYDLLAGRSVFVPADVVISPGVEGVTSGIETNGLASGNSLIEALLHALYELIERDAMAIESFAQLNGESDDAFVPPVRLLDPETAPDDVQRLIAKIEKTGAALRLQDITGDVEVPVITAKLIDINFPGAEGEPVSFGGYGADLDPNKAAIRAVTEAVQSHAVVLLGAREAFEGAEPAPDRQAMLRRRGDAMFGPASRPFPEQGAVSSNDLRDHVGVVLRRIHRAGVSRCIAVDLTREDFGVPVVRVITPELSHPYPASSRRPSRGLLGRVA